MKKDKGRLEQLSEGKAESDSTAGSQLGTAGNIAPVFIVAQSVLQCIHSFAEQKSNTPTLQTVEAGQGFFGHPTYVALSPAAQKVTGGRD